MFKRVLGFILLIVGIACVLFASIYQMVLVYRMFGFIVGGDVTFFIPHWSALFYLGIVPFIWGYLLIQEYHIRNDIKYY